MIPQNEGVGVLSPQHMAPKTRSFSLRSRLLPGVPSSLTHLTISVLEPTLPPSASCPALRGNNQCNTSRRKVGDDPVHQLPRFSMNFISVFIYFCFISFLEGRTRLTKETATEAGMFYFFFFIFKLLYGFCDFFGF